VKDLATANRFLDALDQPAHRALLQADALFTALVRELTDRQTRYRFLQNDHGDATCSHCPHGGCCTKEMVRVLDLLPRLSTDAPLPRAVNANTNCCAFLGAGCTLTPAPLPNICVSFQCGTLSRSGPEGFGTQLEQLAQHAEDIARVMVSYIRENFMLLEGETEIDLMSPAVLVANEVTQPLILLRRTKEKREMKSVAHPSDGAFARWLPVLR